MPYDEDDPFDEDAESEEDTFPDADATESEEELSLAEQLPADSTPSRLQKFVDDPWPTATFILMILGFIIVLGTPVPVWSQWNWMLVGMYFLWILVTVTIIVSLGIWNAPVKSKIRFAGLTTIALALAACVAGTLDTILFVGSGGGLIQGMEGTLLSASSVIVVLSLYSLWLVQKVVQSEQKLEE